MLADVEASAEKKANIKQIALLSPLCLEASRRIDKLFNIERNINGIDADQRITVRQELSTPLVANLNAWISEERRRLSGGNDVAKAMDYMLKR